MFAHRVDPVVTRAEVHDAARRAVEAGCDDAMVLYLYGRYSVGSNYPGEEEYTRRVESAAKAAAASGYPALRRGFATLAAAELMAGRKDLSDDDRRVAEKGLDAALDLLPESVAHDPMGFDWELRWYTLINSVIGAHRRLTSDYKAAYDRVDARIAKVEGVEALRLLVRGNFLLHWGWEARTEAYANQVSEEQFRTFGGRLQGAREALMAAWEASHDEPKVAALMLEVEKATGGGDRGAMETWFARAMEADPDDQEACWSKLDWLDPKWHGGNTFGPMIAFGRACRDTKNWSTGITLLCADAHLRLYNNLAQQDRLPYMTSPGVWPDISSVYGEYLGDYPDDAAERSKYAVLCFFAGRMKESHAQFEQLGEKLTTWPMFPNYPLATLKQIRDIVAHKITPNGAGDAPAADEDAGGGAK
jgi:hypothetical protein